MNVKTYGNDDPLAKSTSSKNLKLAAGSKDDLTAALDNLKASYQSKKEGIQSATVRKNATNRLSYKEELKSELGMGPSPGKVPATPGGGGTKTKKLTVEDLNASSGGRQRTGSRIGAGLGLPSQAKAKDF